MNDLFAAMRPRQAFAKGALWLPGYVSDKSEQLLAEIFNVAAQAPFRRLHTPGGRRMSVATTSCGDCGWYSDEAGYRYVPHDPLDRRPWPHMPILFRLLAENAAREAGYEGFMPQSCLINRYGIGTGMGLHQDLDEGRPEAPIVSVSLGAAACFEFGGLQKTDPLQRLDLLDGDVVVWGGASRFAWHGIRPLRKTLRSDGWNVRYNLTFRAINFACFRT